MVYLITIPTTRERGAEINRCVNSIVRDPTYNTKKMAIIIFGQTNDPTTPLMFSETNLTSSYTEDGYRCLYYLGPDNLQRMIIYLNIGGFKKEELNAFFNFRTYGGARNVLTALAILLAKEPSGIISIDDDEEVLPGFFEEHLYWLGKESRRGVINLVTGPYINHHSYVGIGTLKQLLNRTMNEDRARDALKSITYVDEQEIPNQNIYGIRGARGGNLSRCGSALMIPYISSSEDIPLRGEDEIQAYLNQIINHGTINLYTPKARVKHTKRPGYLLADIKGEVIGVIVHRLILRYLPIIMEGTPLNLTDEMETIKNETQIQLQHFTQEILRAAAKKHYRKKYSKEIEAQLNDLTIDTLRTLSNTQFFVDQVVYHLRTADFGLRNWKKIVECLREAKEEVVRYIFNLPYSYSYTAPHTYTHALKTTA